MAELASEVNFDGILGPSYNHSAIAPGGPGNLASQVNRGKPSNPKAAALDGLTKAERVMLLGVRQGVLPPLVRPNLERLYQVGVIKDRALLRADDLGSLANHLANHAFAAPHLVASAFSGSGVWTANWGTVSPSADTQDQRVHFTPANQSRSFHRSVEGEEVFNVLGQVFSDKKYFSIHQPLPGTYALGDEGAANHLRIATTHGEKGINAFVYGRDGFAEPEAGRRNLARQTLEASRAVARLHNLDPFSTLFIEQDSAAIDAGIFHNDVISSAHLELLFYHERAFADRTRVVSELREAYRALTKGSRSLRTVEVSDDEVSLNEAAVSYLFNSQIVTASDGRMVLIAPRQCQFVERVRVFLEKMTQSDEKPLDDIIFVDIPASMMSGGGPACLRLRVVLTADQEKAMFGRVQLGKDLLKELRQFIQRKYPTEISDGNFTDVDFLTHCFSVTKGLYEILGLTPYGVG